jgi:hypothetical protein
MTHSVRLKELLTTIIRPRRELRVHAWFVLIVMFLIVPGYAIVVGQLALLILGALIPISALMCSIVLWGDENVFIYLKRWLGR